ncbi:MAG: DUF2937 family protein [Steroidobacteraceae bacterium]
MRGLIDRILLVAAVLCAGAVPSFIAQYRQRLGGRLDQVLMDLAPFKEIAARYHNGSLQALIDYHLASADPTFHAEGEAIRQMVTTEARLTAAVQALNADLMHQLGYLAQHLDAALARATWQSFVPSVPLSLQGLVFAALFGVLVWLLFLGAWNLVARLFNR